MLIGFFSVVSFLIGIGLAILFIAFLALIFKKEYEPVRFQIPPPINGQSSTAQWINVFLTRMVASQIDKDLINQCLQEIKNGLLNSPDIPTGPISELEIKVLQPSRSPPLFKNFVINQEDADHTSVSCQIRYEGNISLYINLTGSAGPASMPKLLSLNMKAEVLLRSLTASVSFVFTNNSNEIIAHIGNDLVVAIDVRPLLGDLQNCQTRYIGSISDWINGYINKEFKNKNFVLYGNRIIE